MSTRPATTSPDHHQEPPRPDGCASARDAEEVDVLSRPVFGELNSDAGAMVSGPVSGILSLFSQRVAIHLCGLPGSCPRRDGRAVHASCLALLRMGFTEPPGSPPTLVRSYRTVSPLPVTASGPSAVCSLLHSAVRSPRPGSRQHPAQWSPDFPRHGLMPCRGHPAHSPSHHPLYGVLLSSSSTRR